MRKAIRRAIRNDYISHGPDTLSSSMETTTKTSKFNSHKLLRYSLEHLVWAGIFVGSAFLSFRTRIAPVSSFWFPSAFFCAAMLLRPQSPFLYKVSFTLMYCAIIMLVLSHLHPLSRILASGVSNFVHVTVTLVSLQWIATGNLQKRFSCLFATSSIHSASTTYSNFDLDQQGTCTKVNNNSTIIDPVQVRSSNRSSKFFSNLIQIIKRKKSKTNSYGTLNCCSSPSSWIPINFSSVRQGVAFIVSGVLGAAIAACISGVTWLLTGISNTFSEPFLIWFSSVCTGYFLIVPVILSIKHQIIDRWDVISSKEKLNAKWKNIVSCVILILLTPIPIWLSSSLISSKMRLVVGLYIDFPIILLSVSLGGILAANLTVFAAGISSIVFLVDGKFLTEGYERYSVAESIATIAIFVIILCMVSILFAAVLFERDRALYCVEEQVKERTAQLENAMKALKGSKSVTERLSSEKSEFMAFLCHELRNPLHAILNIIENDLEILYDSRLSSSSLESSQDHFPKTCCINASLDDTPLMNAAGRNSFMNNANAFEASCKSVLSFSKYMMTLLNDVLDFEKLGSPTAQLQFKVFDLHRSIQELVDRSRLYLNRKSIHLDYKMHRHVPRYVYLDKTKILQVISNLISNGFKFTPKNGKIKLNLRVERAQSLKEDESGSLKSGSNLQIHHHDSPKSLLQHHFDAKNSLDVASLHGIPINNDQESTHIKENDDEYDHREDEMDGSQFLHPRNLKETENIYLVCSVCDNGPGLSEGDAQHIFEPYRQVSQAVHEYTGSGLGLSIAYRIVQAFGGTLHAESNEDKGACFIARFPLKEFSNSKDTLETLMDGDSEALHTFKQAPPQQQEITSSNADIGTQNLDNRNLKDFCQKIDRNYYSYRISSSNGSANLADATIIEENCERISRDPSCSRREKSTPTCSSNEYTFSSSQFIGKFYENNKDNSLAIIGDIAHELSNDVGENSPLSFERIPTHSEFEVPGKNTLEIADLKKSPVNHISLAKHKVVNEVCIVEIGHSAEDCYLSCQGNENHFKNAQHSKEKVYSESNSLETENFPQAAQAITVNENTCQHVNSEGREKHGSSESDHHLRGKGKNKRYILVVDDSEINRKILVRMLSKVYSSSLQSQENLGSETTERENQKGFEIHQASNGREAVEKAKQFPYNLIFMDIVMPVMDGYEASLKIKELMHGQVVIVAASGNIMSTTDCQERLAHCGIAETLGKPFTAKHIKDILLRYRCISL